jgi:hypothetical protein
MTLFAISRYDSDGNDVNYDENDFRHHHNSTK